MKLSVAMDEAATTGKKPCAVRCLGIEATDVHHHWIAAKFTVDYWSLTDIKAVLVYP